MECNATRCMCRISSRRPETWLSRFLRAVCSRRRSVTRVLYCSIETPWNSDKDVEDGAGRRVREFMVSGRIVLVLVGRPLGNWTKGPDPGDSSRSDEPKCPEGLMRMNGESDGGLCFCREGRSTFELSGLDCIRAIANSRSIIFTSSVFKRCSTVRPSSCCIVCTKLLMFGGRLTWSA